MPFGPGASLPSGRAATWTASYPASASTSTSALSSRGSSSAPWTTRCTRPGAPRTSSRSWSPSGEQEPAAGRGPGEQEVPVGAAVLHEPGVRGAPVPDGGGAQPHLSRDLDEDVGVGLVDGRPGCARRGSAGPPRGAARRPAAPSPGTSGTGAGRRARGTPGPRWPGRLTRRPPRARPAPGLPRGRRAAAAGHPARPGAARAGRGAPGPPPRCTTATPAPRRAAAPVPRCAPRPWSEPVPARQARSYGGNSSTRPGSSRRRSSRPLTVATSTAWRTVP